MKALSFEGERDGGKTENCNTISAIHGHYSTSNSELTKSIYRITAGEANTDAKYGNAISKTTYPIVISEFGTIEKYGRDEKFGDL